MTSPLHPLAPGGAPTLHGPRAHRRAARAVAGPAALTAMFSLLAGLALAVLPGSPAAAQAQVSVTSEVGDSRVHLDQPTTVQVSGSGFQSVEGGFGGIYVLFGWVDDPSGGSWKPSNGGQTARDYLYVPDVEARDNQGYQRFVNFPGSSTSSAANGGELGADGTWSLEMVIPGPRFTARDRTGTPTEVDCTERTCGVITIGAHGVVNSTNETFTPVTFVDAGGADVGGGGGGEARAGTQGEASEAAVGGTGEAPAAGEGDEPGDLELPSGPATVGLEQETVQAGRVVAFTGRGFAVGEQVVATLGAGEAGAGPLLAGEFGEVAGAVELPPDIRPGTHVLRLEGAGSGQVAEAELSVMADPASLTPVEEESSGWSWAFFVAVLTASLLLILIVSSLITALVRRRRKKKAAAAAKAAGDTAVTSDPQSPGPAPAWPAVASAPESATSPSTGPAPAAPASPAPAPPAGAVPPAEAGRHAATPRTDGVLPAPRPDETHVIPVVNSGAPR